MPYIWFFIYTYYNSINNVGIFVIAVSLMFSTSFHSDSRGGSLTGRKKRTKVANFFDTVTDSPPPVASNLGRNQFIINLGILFFP